MNEVSAGAAGVASRSQGPGDSLLTTAAIRGHRNLQTTRKYAQLTADPIRAAADRVAGDMAALLGGTVTPVTPLKRAPRRGTKPLPSGDHRA